MAVKFHRLALYNAKEKKEQMTENRMKDGQKNQRKPQISASVRKHLIDNFDLLSERDRKQLLEELPAHERDRLLLRH